jgi:hypothetical protein
VNAATTAPTQATTITAATPEPERRQRIEGTQGHQNSERQDAGKPEGFIKRVEIGLATPKLKQRDRQ